MSKEERIEEIGIVGIGCRFPGANDIHEFWKLLENGENHVKDIPKDRWDNDKIYSEDFDEPGKIYVKKAGLLSEHDMWDNRLFGISDREAIRIDPQQRYVLECTHMALEDAGITRKELSGTNTGVFIGVMNDDYKSLMGTDHGEDNNFTATGLSTTVMASRVSYVYNLHGPCMTIDTACSSAMMAMHLGCQAIRAGECDIAICGGVNSILSPDMFLPLCKARMLSKTGQCQTFCDTADGYARSEGCGIVILQSTKTPSKVKNLWGILHTGINQDGRAAKPMTAPSGDQQQELLQKVYERYKVNPKDLDYIEVHGTGTPIGDPTEVNAISSFFTSTLKRTKDSNSDRKILMGSVKSNIGHTESAAAVAGIIKVLLMMRYGKIVKSLHIKEDKSNLNKGIKIEDTVLDISVHITEWPKNEFGNRVACVNSFGFGGSNGHAIVKQYSSSIFVRENHNEAIQDSNMPYFVCLYGKDKTSLSNNVECFKRDTQMYSENLYNISYTSINYRDRYERRKLLHGTTLDEIYENAHSESNSNNESVQEQKPNIVFVFCGVGTTWSKMGAKMYQIHPVFRDTVRRINKHMQVQEYSNFNVEEMLTGTEYNNDPFRNHVAIFTVQIALFEMWKSIGIVPNIIIGQSVGEVAAAYASGALDLSSAVKVIYYRSKILAKTKGGAMTVIGNVNSTEIDNVCSLPKYDNSLNIAVYNSPSSCTVSGSETAIKDLEKNMSTHEGAFIRSLKVVCAYHSQLVDSCLPDISAALTGLESSSEHHLPQVSTVTCELVKSKEMTSPHYWTQNVRKPVLFMQAVKKVASTELTNVYLEIGPRQVLKVHLPNILSEKQKNICLPSMNVNDEISFYRSMSTLFGLGIDIDFTSLLVCEGTLSPLPRYHFNKTSPLFISNLTKQYLLGLSNSRGGKKYLEKVDENRFQVLINQETTPFVFDHQLLGHITVPGATYVETVITSATDLLKVPPENLELSASFENPCMLERGQTTVLTAFFTRDDNGYLEYSVYVDERVLSKGHVNERKISECNEIDIKGLRMRLSKKKLADEIYGVLEKIGLTYGESLRLITECIYLKDECLSAIHIPTCIQNDMRNYSIHPAVVDAMFQTSGILSTDIVAGAFAGIPKGLKTLRVFTTAREKMFVYTKLTKSTRINSYYTTVLCTENGAIVAEIRNLTLRSIDTGIPNDDISYNLNWHEHEISDNVMRKNKAMAREELIVFGSYRLNHWLSTCNHHFTFIEIPSDQDHFKNLAMECFRKSKSGCKFVFGPCYNINQFFDRDNLKVYNIIKTNANLLKTFLTVKSSLPHNNYQIFVVTEMTQHLPFIIHEKQNFLGAELWGFTRSAMTEMPNEDIRLIDVDLRDESVQSFFSLLMNAEERVPEALVRTGRIYVCEIRQSVTQDIDTFSTSLVEGIGPLSLCSNSLYNDSELFLANIKNTEDIYKAQTKKKEDAKIKVATVYIKQTDRMKTKANVQTNISDDKLYPKAKIKSNEFVGWILTENSLWKEETYGVCFPITVSTDVTVPKRCCFVLKDIPFYTPGLISEMTVLFKICKMVKANSNVLIMVSDINSWRANILIRVLKHYKSKGKIVVWEDLPFHLCSRERVTHAIVLHFEKTKDIFTLNSITGLQYLISVNSWLPWDTVSVSLHNIVKANVQILKLEEILNEKCSINLVPKVIKYLKTDATYLDKYLPQALTDQSMSDTSLPYSCIEVQSSSMDTKIPVVLYPSSCFRKDGCYIFVGGTSGLGWELLQYCAQLGAGNLITISRRGLTKEKKAEIERIENLHRCNILHIRADVTDIESLQNCFKILRNKNANVKGIFHGAGLLKDTLLNNMTSEDLETALRPKVLGTLNLHYVSEDLSLDFFVTHSSITAIFGNPGQCNYAAGNSFQDSFAFFRASHGYNAQSINWGALHVGMAKESGPDFANRFRRQGIHILNSNDVKSCFNEALLTKEIQKIFGIFDWQRFSKSPIYSSSQNKFRNLIQDTGLTSKPLQTTDIGMLCDDFYEKPLEMKRQYLTDIISSTLMDSLVVGKENIQQNADLYKLGIDSMSAMSISNSLHQYTSVRIPVVFLLSNTTTIESLNDFLLRALHSHKGNGMSVNDNEELIQYDILNGSVTFMQTSILKNLDTEEPENFIRSFCYEIKGKTIETTIWTQVIIKLLKFHPELRKIFVWDPIDKMFQAKEVEVDKTNVPIVVVAFENIFETSTKLSLDPRKDIPIKVLLACEGRRTKMKVFLHAVIVDMQSINILFRDLESCARHILFGGNPPDVQNVNVADIVRQALTPQFKYLQSFWKDQFSRSIEPFSFSPLVPKTLVEEKWYEMIHVCSENQFDDIMCFVRSEKFTLYNFVLSVYFLCIHELTRLEYIPLVTNTNLRGFIPALENILTRCINEVPVIGRVKSKMTVSEYLQETARQLHRITEHGTYPFELIKREMKSENLQQNIGRHRFIIDDISNVSKQLVQKDVTVKINAIRHRRHNYETCLFIYVDMDGKKLNLDLGFNTEALSMDSANHLLRRLEFLMDTLISCDLSVSIENILKTEKEELNDQFDIMGNMVNRNKTSFERILASSTGESETHISKTSLEKKWKSSDTK